MEKVLAKRLTDVAEAYHSGAISYEEFTAAQRKNWAQIESLHRSEQVLAILRGAA